VKVSAFLPVTNAVARGDTFIEAIKTHLYWADELVVVDGGSTDGTLEEIERIGDSRIRVIHFPWPQENWSWTQFCKTWNAGLDACTGDWVAAGESDHIFHENEAGRIREEINRETSKGKAVMKCQKLQSASVEYWQSKSQMYYFVYKGKYPQIRYGYDPNHETDLCHPIWWEGSMIEDIPAGEAIVESSRYAHLIGGTGAVLYNYLWTFKTLDMVVQERLKAARAWNQFPGFTKGYGKSMQTDPDKVVDWIVGQIAGVRAKATRHIPLEQQPLIMQEKIKTELYSNMVGAHTFLSDNARYSKLIF
jgi:glycosyltransferase involved in cell wall biosynthesis